MLRSDLCNYGDAYIVVKGRISVTGYENANRKNINQLSRIMLRLDHVYQKSITHLKEIQKILILLCRCIGKFVESL